MLRVPFVLALLAALPSLPSAATPEKPPDDKSDRASSAPSSSAKPATPPSSQARALSRALVPKQTWDRLLDRSAEGLSAAVSRSLTTKGAKVPSGLQGNIRRELGQSMKYESAIDTQAQALQKRFTTEEMDSAARFYGSPTGQKMLQHLPEAQSEVGDALQEQLAVVVPEILHRVAPDAMTPTGEDAGPQRGAPSASSPAPQTEGTGSGP
jgi:hypothetical protein